MSDISKCENQSCPLKQHCYRWTAIPNEYWQSYSPWQYTITDGKFDCDGYWGNRSVRDNFKEENYGEL